MHKEYEEVRSFLVLGNTDRKAGSKLLHRNR